MVVLSILINVSGGLPEAVAQNVDFPDSNLAAVVRGALGLGATDPIPQTNLAGLTQLEADNAGITNLTGLEQATGLTTLYLRSNQIVDVSPLSGLTNLTWLDLERNQIRDIRRLTGLTNLGTLGLGGNQISDIRPLAGLTSLTWLDIGENQISDLRPRVEGMPEFNNAFTHTILHYLLRERRVHKSFKRPGEWKLTDSELQNRTK